MTCIVAGVFAESTTDFTVDATSVEPKGDGVTKAVITSPTGIRTEAIVKNKKDGYYECLYTPQEQGMYSRTQILSRIGSVMHCIMLWKGHDDSYKYSISIC
jgi:hypothetical protein